jgi:hypothetical protein
MREMRFLSADVATNAGAHRAQIWQVFARHGIGYSAYGVDGTVMTGTRYDAAYDQPPDLQTLLNPVVTSDPLTLSSSLGSSYSYTVTATNPNAGTLTFALTSGPAGMKVDPATGKVTWLAVFASQRVKITVTDGKGGTVVHGFELPVLTHLAAGSPARIGGLEGSAGYADIAVPAGVPVLQVTLRGGSGDADLWVLDPDGNTDYSMRVGNNETLSYALPAPGDWQVAVFGYSTYSGLTLTGSLVTPTPLIYRTTLTGLSGVESSESLYMVAIPPGATSFSISTSGGTGDVDLFLKRGQAALCQVSDSVSQICSKDDSSDVNGNSESIALTNPDAGDWYVELSAYEEYRDVTLVTSLTAPATLAVDVSGLSFTALEGGTAPAAQGLTLSNLVGSTYNWTAQATTSEGGAWLSIDKASGAGDATIGVSVDPGNIIVPSASSQLLKAPPLIGLTAAPRVVS